MCLAVKQLLSSTVIVAHCYIENFLLTLLKEIFPICCSVSCTGVHVTLLWYNITAYMKC